MAFTKDSLNNYKMSRPTTKKSEKKKTRYKPSKNLCEEWPEVFKYVKDIPYPNNRFAKAQDEEHVIFLDPRPDLAAEDALEHVNWLILLAEAYEINPDLAITLHGFRCEGLRIVKGQNGYILRPEISHRGFESEEKYQQTKEKYLAPYTKEIKFLIKKLNSI